MLVLPFMVNKDVYKLVELKLADNRCLSGIHRNEVSLNRARRRDPSPYTLYSCGSSLRFYGRFVTWRCN